MTGGLYTMVRERAIGGEDVVAFLRHLLRCIPGRVIVVWDRASIHRCRRVQEFLAQPQAARLELVSLPGYAPELNPADGVWGYLKRVELGNLSCQSIRRLKRELRKATMRLRTKQDILRACVRQPGCYTP